MSVIATPRIHCYIDEHACAVDSITISPFNVLPEEDTHPHTPNVKIGEADRPKKYLNRRGEVVLVQSFFHALPDERSPRFGVRIIAGDISRVGQVYDVYPSGEALRSSQLNDLIANVRS